MHTERFSATPEVRSLAIPSVEALIEQTFDANVTVITSGEEQKIAVFTALETQRSDQPITIIEPNQWSDDHCREFNRLRSAYLRSVFDGKARVICPDMPGVGLGNSPLTPLQQERLTLGRFDAIAAAQWQAMLAAQTQLFRQDSPALNGDNMMPWRGRRILLNGYSMGSNQVAALLSTMPEAVYAASEEIIVVMSQTPSFRQRSIGDLALSMMAEGGKDRAYYVQLNGNDKRLHSAINYRSIATKASLWQLPRAMGQGAVIDELLENTKTSTGVMYADKLKVVIIHAEGRVSRATDNLYAELALQKAGVRDVERRMILDEYHAGTESLQFHAALVRYSAREWLKGL